MFKQEINNCNGKVESQQLICCKKAIK